jgi:hypothetical protein
MGNGDRLGEVREVWVEKMCVVERSNSDGVDVVVDDALIDVASVADSGSGVVGVASAEVSNEVVEILEAAIVGVVGAADTFVGTGSMAIVCIGPISKVRMRPDEVDVEGATVADGASVPTIGAGPILKLRALLVVVANIEGAALGTVSKYP